MSESISKGTILIAKDVCLMDEGKGNALIIGKEYPINTIFGNLIEISSEIDSRHLFGRNPSDVLSYWGKYFTIKK